MDRFLIKKPRFSADKQESTCTSIPGPASAEQDVNCAGLSRNKYTSPCTSGADSSQKEPSCSSSILEKNKRGKSRRFLSHWQDSFKWIQYDSSNDIVLCSLCKEAENKGFLTFSSKKDDTFISNGFKNWKKGMEKLKAHEKSSCHQESTTKLAFAVQKKSHVTNKFIHQNDIQMQSASDALLCVFTTLRYLTRQGLAIRNCGSYEEVKEEENAEPEITRHWQEDNSNFIQCLLMRQDDSTALQKWMKGNKKYKWFSNKIQNEIIEMMANDVIRSVIKDVMSNGIYSIIADETCDSSKREQVCICFRHVSDNFCVFEDFIGLYQVDSTDAGTLFTVIKDVLDRTGCCFEKCRGQAYDGASNVSGKFNGLQARVKEVQPKAIYIHCAAHTLNLAVQDSVKNVSLVRDTFCLVKEVVNFIRESPKRIACFSSFKKDDKQISLRPLCPTRWTVRVKSVKSLLANCIPVLEFLEDYAHNDNTETGAKSNGLFLQLSRFETFFALNLIVLILEPVELVNEIIQAPAWSVGGMQSKIEALEITIQSMRSDKKFTEVWTSVVSLSEKNSYIDPPALPRRKLIPRRYDDNPSNEHNFNSPKVYFRKLYFEALDCVLQTLKERFSANLAFKSVVSMEEELLKALNGNPYKLENLTVEFKSDFNEERLELQLKMMNDVLSEKKIKVSSVHDVVNVLKTDRYLAELFSEVSSLIKLLLVIPLTTCSAERSFSALKRIKTYLRTTMTQKRLNNVCTLNVHKDKTDALNIRQLVNDFIKRNPHRIATFKPFSDKIQ